MSFSRKGNYSDEDLKMSIYRLEILFKCAKRDISEIRCGEIGAVDGVNCG